MACVVEISILAVAVVEGGGVRKMRVDYGFVLVNRLLAMLMPTVLMDVHQRRRKERQQKGQGCLSRPRPPHEGAILPDRHERGQDPGAGCRRSPADTGVPKGLPSGPEMETEPKDLL